ncbi:hypothetical protein [uncultured Aquimarina sp.]|uniref:hypothetical protein n=1 Tax=uncultured Aquimarina sp. TaxID=575652 RepID=UPI0026178A2D|nr:hypothetical protein [uncultured Aquimarina sp.]
MSFFNNISLNRYRKYIEIGFGILILYAVLFNYIHLLNSITHNYLPVWSDEFFYFINTNSFFQNGVLEAALTYNGEGSRILGVDAHGFGYPLLHGGIAKIFGWDNLNFIYFNFISVLISVLLMCCIRRITITEKLWVSNLILMFPFFILYGVTYMQESIHILIALVISVLVYFIYNKEDNKVYIVLFLITIFIAGIFRALWFFWLIGLIPLAKSNKQLIIYFSLFLLGVVMSFVFVLFFTEPVPNYFSSLVVLLKNNKIGEGLVSLLFHFYDNLNFYFFGKSGDLVYKSMKYLNFGIVTYFSYLAFKNKSRLTIAIALIGTLNFLLLFTIYDAFDWREIRTMSPLFYFYIIFIVSSSRRITHLLIIILCCLFFPTLKISNQWIQERNNVQIIYDKKDVYKEIGKKIVDNKLTLLGYIPRDYSTDLLDLPLSNISGSPIRYIIPYYNVEKKYFDYTIIRPNTNTQNFKIIDNKYYILTDNRKKKNEQFTLEQELPVNLSENEYIELSLSYFRKRAYFKSIESSLKAIKLNSSNIVAYNNLGASYNMLLMHDKAKEALDKALLIDPNFNLVLNNRKIAVQGIERRVNKGFTEKEYLGLSFNYYNTKNYHDCIKVSEELLSVFPDNATAYNNMCISYNNLGEWEKAIQACENSLHINSDFELAKNNLEWAKSELNK